MQDGVDSKQQATANLPRCSEHGNDIIHQGAQGGNGVGLKIAWEGSADRARSHSRTSSLGGCGAGSLILGHGTKDNANEDGVVSMVRSGERVPVPGLRHGASANSYTSSEESRGRRTGHRRGKPSVFLSGVEIRAGAVSACTGLGREHTPSRGGGDVRHSAKEASDSRMVSEVPPRHLHSAHREAKQRNPKRKHSKPFYTVPARRQWAPGSGPFAHPRHHPRGHGSEEHGGVPSGGTQVASRSGPELMRTVNVISMLGGRRVLSGGGADREQPGASVMIERC
jgi:hypothetical protein